MLIAIIILTYLLLSSYVAHIVICRSRLAKEEIVEALVLIFLPPVFLLVEICGVIKRKLNIRKVRKRRREIFGSRYDEAEREEEV